MLRFVRYGRRPAEQRGVAGGLASAASAPNQSACNARRSHGIPLTCGSANAEGIRVVLGKEAAVTEGMGKFSPRLVQGRRYVR